MTTPTEAGPTAEATTAAATDAATDAAMPSPWALVGRQVAFSARILWRDPQALFFSLALPLILLVLFVAMFGNGWTESGGGRQVRASTYYVAAIVAFAVVDTSFMTLLVSVVTQRERGLLRRRALTPEPSWVLTIGTAFTVAVAGLVTVTTLLVVGWVAYGVTIPSDTLPGAVLALVVGTASLCCVAYAVSPLVRTAEAALPAAAAFSLPLFFISGVFSPWEFVPSTLQVVAMFFPVRPLADALVRSFDPATSGFGYLGRDLAIMAAWGLAGLLVARRWFRHVPTAR